MTLELIWHPISNSSDKLFSREALERSIFMHPVRKTTCEIKSNNNCKNKGKNNKNKVKSLSCDYLWPHGLYSPRNSPGQNTGVGRLYLFQGIFPTQESDRGFLHCRQILYQLTYQGKPIKGNNICPMHTYMDCNLIHWIISF